MKFTHLKPYFFITERRKHENVHKPNASYGTILVVLHATFIDNVLGFIIKCRKLNEGMHFIIDKDGRIYQGAPIDTVVKHSGSSYGPFENKAHDSTATYEDGTYKSGASVDFYSIGIAFVNTNDISERITPEQYESHNKLIHWLSQELPTLKYIALHSDVSPRRVNDPLPLIKQKIELPDSIQWWEFTRWGDGYNVGTTNSLIGRNQSIT